MSKPSEEKAKPVNFKPGGLKPTRKKGALQPVKSDPHLCQKNKDNVMAKLWDHIQVAKEKGNEETAYKNSIVLAEYEAGLRAQEKRKNDKELGNPSKVTVVEPPPLEKIKSLGKPLKISQILAFLNTQEW